MLVCQALEENVVSLNMVAAADIDGHLAGFAAQSGNARM